MRIKARFVGFKAGFDDFKSTLIDLFAVYGYEIAENEEGYDFLVQNCNAISLKGNDFYTEEINLSSGKFPFKTLLVSGENSEKIHSFPYFTRRILHLVRNILRVFEKIKGNKGRIRMSKNYYRMAKFLFELEMKSYLFKEFNIFSKHGDFFYYRPDFSKYVENLPCANNYAMITNKIKSGNQKSLFIFPLFLSNSRRNSLNEIKNLVQIKEDKFYEKKTKFCAFIATNDINLSILAYARGWFCMELSKYKKVDCYGAALNNIQIPAKLLEKHCKHRTDLSHFTEEDIASACRNKYHPDCGYVDRDALNQELFRDYKFVICFENSMAEDYITEKLPDVMLGNSVGIYHGAPNVGEYFNTKSFINCHDYPNYSAVIERIIELDQNHEEYAKIAKEPFFVGNKIPQSILDKEKELKGFLDKVFYS